MRKYTFDVILTGLTAKQLDDVTEKYNVTDVEMKCKHTRPTAKRKAPTTPRRAPRNQRLRFTGKAPKNGKGQTLLAYQAITKFTKPGRSATSTEWKEVLVQAKVCKNRGAASPVITALRRGGTLEAI